VKGSIGAMSAFMAQAGSLVVLGDAGAALGDSIYEATIFVRGNVQSLGTDCIEKPMTPVDRERLAGVLHRAGLNGEAKVDDFRMYGSARQLYHFHVDNIASY
jgi:glutamate synthase domain-containing protein 3